MKKLSSTEKIITEELESHLSDKTAELVLSGLSPQEAREKAKQDFGDFTKIKTATIAAYSVNPLKKLQRIILLAYSIFTILLFSAFFIARGTETGAKIEQITLYWLATSIISLTLLFIFWVSEYYGFRKPTVIFSTYITTIIISFITTVVLDIDNFEVNVQAIFLGALLLLITNISWKRLGLKTKQWLVYGFTLIVIISTFLEKPIFDFIGQARCLFLTLDNIPLVSTLASCQQVNLWSSMLWPLYLTLIIGTPYFIYFLVKYWLNSGSKRYRKIALSSIAGIFIITPLFWRDINNYGQVDIISWKPKIYRAYQDVLGRNPQEKDLEFYAVTRSYLQMEKVRAVLYQSAERKIKINKIYQEVLGRPATAEEIDFYVDSQTTVEEIQQSLENKK